MAGRIGMLVEHHPSTPRDWMDGDMRPAELAQVFADLRFPRGGGFVSVELDAEVARYISRLLRERARGRRGD